MERVQLDDAVLKPGNTHRDKICKHRLSNIILFINAILAFKKVRVDEKPVISYDHFSNFVFYF